MEGKRKVLPGNLEGKTAYTGGENTAEVASLEMADTEIGDTEETTSWDKEAELPDTGEINEIDEGGEINEGTYQIIEIYLYIY